MEEGCAGVITFLKVLLLLNVPKVCIDGQGKIWNPTRLNFGQDIGDFVIAVSTISVNCKPGSVKPAGCPARV